MQFTQWTKPISNGPSGVFYLLHGRSHCCCFNRRLFAINLHSTPLELYQELQRSLQTPSRLFGPPARSPKPKKQNLQSKRRCGHCILQSKRIWKRLGDQAPFGLLSMPLFWQPWTYIEPSNSNLKVIYCHFKLLPYPQCLCVSLVLRAIFETLITARHLRAQEPEGQQQQQQEENERVEE